MPDPSFTPDTFRIRTLKRDMDAIILIGVGITLTILAVIGLAFLPDPAWDRLVERSRLIWLALPGVLAVCVAMYGRFQIRRSAVKAMGATAAAVAPEIARGELYANAAAAWAATEDGTSE